MIRPTVAATAVTSASCLLEVADGYRQVTAWVKRLGPAVELHFDVVGGHVRRGARAEVVADVFQMPELSGDVALHISVPLGDVELIDELRQRCVSLDTRAAGSTCLIDARLR
jgi:hypothetical protein